MSVKEKMTAIADSIRERTGDTKPLTLDDMASSVNEVYEAGKKAEYDEFWDNYQNYGKRTNYIYAFSHIGWNRKAFKPKYDIKPTGDGGQYMFSNGGENSAFDLKKRLEEQGVVLDLSGLTSSSREFYLSRFTELPTLDFSGCASMTNTFDYWSGIKLTLILSENGETTFSSVFRRCVNLTNVAIEKGTIGKSISFADTSLNVVSAINVITHLKSYTGTDGVGLYTLTFKDTTKTALQEAGALDELDGKTYDAYIADIGWNLA